MNKDRIQIDGVWYVKESNVKPTTKKVEIDDADITKYKGATYETDDYCWEATKMYKEDGSLYSGLDIKFTDKAVDLSEGRHWNNDLWMRGVLESDPEALEEAREVMDEEGIAYFQAFLAKLREDFWL